jgi:uncharacterized protein
MSLASPGFKIELREGFLQAWLRILEPTGIVLSEVMHAARTLGVCYGMDQALLNELARAGFPPGEYLLAQGKPPQSGEDGQITWLVQLVPKPKPVEITDESIRYFPVHINSVKKGQKLLTYRPSTFGVSGTTVLGTEVAGAPGSARANPQGMNTDYSTADPGCLVASISGNLLWDGQYARVEPGYFVGGNLSLVNGERIDFAGDLHVSGDVQVGMTLVIGGSLTVTGSVEDTVIDCGGDVTIKGGAFGSKRGIITAGGAIEVYLAHDYILRAARDVSITREAVNCQIDGRSVLASRAEVYGGTIVARRYVEVRNLGREEYAKTSVTIGNRRQIQDAIEAIEVELETCDSKMSECNNWIVKLSRAAASGSGRSKDLEARVQGKRAELDGLKERVRTLNQEKTRLQEDLRQLAPKLIVLGTIRRNIHLTMNDVSLLFDEPEARVTLREEEGKILKSVSSVR